MARPPHPLRVLLVSVAVFAWFLLVEAVPDGLDAGGVTAALSVAGSVALVMGVSGLVVPAGRRLVVWFGVVLASLAWAFGLLLLRDGAPEVSDLVFAGGFGIIAGVGVPLAWRSEDRRRQNDGSGHLVAG